MANFTAERLRRNKELQRICVNCGKAFGFHGARAPHDCPTEPTSPGRYPDPTTTFKAAPGSGHGVGSGEGT